MNNRRIRKWIALTLALALLMITTIGCRQEKEPEKPPIDCLSYRGQSITPDSDVEALLSLLGDDYTLKEAESCAGIGWDRIYQYPSLSLHVFASKSGEARINLVKYTDDGADHCGVRIGSSAEDVIATFGEATFFEEDELSYRREGCLLTFMLRDGVVTGIILQRTYPV